MFSFSSHHLDRRLTTFESILPSHPDIPLERINEEKDPEGVVGHILCESEDALREDENFLRDLMEGLSVEAILAKLQLLHGAMAENPTMMRALDDPRGELMEAAFVPKNRGLWSENCAKGFQKVLVP